MVARTRIWQLGLLTSVLSLLAMSVARADDVYFDVSVRGTGTATIHANVYNNPGGRGATTILAVHGLTETGSTFQPLADAIFADSTLNRAVKRIVSIDLIGHGESSTPTNLPPNTRFSDLLIEDNASVVIQSIDKLKSLNLGAQVIMGHSMGGLAIQHAQEVLLSANSSLRQKGILGAILIASVPARSSVWTQPPPSNVGPFIVNDPVLGPYLDLPAAVVAQGTGFRTLAGTVVPNAPTAAQIEANDWVGIEPLSTLAELTGTMPPVIRPDARRGAFASSNGTLLAVVGFAQDVLTPAVDQDDLYRYLTNTNTTTLYRQINTADAVHSMFISNPTAILSAIRNSVF